MLALLCTQPRADSSCFTPRSLERTRPDGGWQLQGRHLHVALALAGSVHAAQHGHSERVCWCARSPRRSSQPAHTRPSLMRRCADFNDDCAAGRITPSPLGSCALVPIVAASAFASRTFEGVPPDPVQCVHTARCTPAARAHKRCAGISASLRWRMRTCSSRPTGTSPTRRGGTCKPTATTRALNASR